MGVKRLICAFAILGLVACGAGAGKGPGGSKGPIASETNDPGLENRNRTTTGGETVPSLVTVYFDYDDSALRPDAKDGLRRNAEYLRSVANAKVELQGNCDERGTEEYNLALGKRRAESAKHYLADLGISPQRLSTVSFGEENPASPGQGEAAWAKNRRVDFILR
jgi:peptidoglycan-associated lipoprotein